MSLDCLFYTIRSPAIIFRGSPEAYLYDASTLELAKKLLLNEEGLPLHGKVAIVICHLHSENIADHEAIKILAAKIIKLIEPCVARALKQMIACHHERLSLALFHKIPERNVVLSTVSTRAETLYLQEVKHTVSHDDLVAVNIAMSVL